MGARFELDEARAAEWLAANMGQQIESYPGEDIIELDPDWETSDDSDGSTARTLVAAAVTAGVLTGPAGIEISYEYDVEADSGSCHWLVCVSAAGVVPLLRLVAGFHPPHDLAFGLRGAAAMLEVLTVAVAEGNAILDGLDAYVAARTGG